ncbi:MAG: hypothetical protein ABI415_06865 [Flavitalea sp.]
MKIELITILSFIAVLSYFVPLGIVMFKNLWQDPFFMLFAIFWAIGGLINVSDLIPGFSKETRDTLGAFYNMLDIPFILSIFYYTTTSLLVRKFSFISGIVFILIEIINAYQKGISYDAIKYTLGTGVGLVLIVVIWEIIRYFKVVEHSNRQNAKIFIHAALLFEYGTFVLIYIFDYFVAGDNHNDIYLIYYISTLIAVFIASCGYLLFKKYEKKSPVF